MTMSAKKDNDDVNNDRRERGFMERQNYGTSKRDGAKGVARIKKRQEIWEVQREWVIWLEGCGGGGRRGGQRGGGGRRGDSSICEGRGRGSRSNSSNRSSSVVVAAAVVAVTSLEQ